MTGQSTSSEQQATSTSNSFPAWTQAAGQNLYDKIAARYPSWTPYSGPVSAAFGPGTATANTYATGALGQPNAQQTAAGNTLGSVVSSINPGAGPGQYFNPYVQATLNPTLQNLQTANAQENQQTGAAATLSGAYGGTGQGVQSALNNYFTGQNVANASGQAYSNAYNSAINQQQTALNQLLGAASGQSGLGTSEMTGNTGLAALLASIGNQQQGAGQTGIQNAIALNQQNQLMPLSEASQMASILATLPKDTTGQSTTTGQTSQPNNVLYSLLGSILGNAGLFGGYNPTTGASSGLTSLFQLSDVRAKEDIAPVGRLYDGQNVYSFRYKGDATPRIGLMAQEIERIRPDAVRTMPSGFKAVDYAKATEGSRLLDLISRIAA